MTTVSAVALFTFAAWRLSRVVDARMRPVVAFGVAAALVLSAYGVLGALSSRAPGRDPLRFVDERGGELVVREDTVVKGRAHPNALLAAAALAALSSALLRSRQGPGWPRRRRRWSPALLLLFAPYLLTFYGGLANPPRGFDALWYHLPAAVAFARNHHLEPPGRDLVFYFPANL
jgi:hypothetical protein